MAYQSVHTGPEVDAAASLLDDIQEIRDESNANKDTVVTLAAQVATDANRTEAAAVAVDGVVAAAESARDAAVIYRDEAGQHAADADTARAQAVVARNGAEAAESSVAQHAADAQAAATTAGTHASNAASSEAVAAQAASDAATAKDAAESARDAAQSSATSANTDAGRAETAAASVDGVVAAAESARDAAQGFRNESEGFRDEAQQAAQDAASVVLGNVFDDTQVRDDRGWSSEKIAQEIANAAPEIPLATPSHSGLMSGSDKGKLDGVATGATANATDAQLRDRATHTGTQPASTITGLATVATSGSYNDLSNRPAIPTIPGVATPSADGLMASGDKSKLDGIQAGAQVNSVTSVAGKTGAVSLASSDVGLGRVNNITDTVSTAQPSGGADGDAWDVVE